MSTTDLQRLRQDEWLADLLSTEDEQGHGPKSGMNEPLCVLGRAARTAGNGTSWSCVDSWLGISTTMGETLWLLNDGDSLWLLNDGDSLGIRFEDGESRSFAEIAGWFKEQRDLWDGDLSNWTPAQ